MVRRGPASVFSRMSFSAAGVGTSGGRRPANREGAAFGQRIALRIGRGGRAAHRRQSQGDRGPGRSGRLRPLGSTRGPRCGKPRRLSETGRPHRAPNHSAFRLERPLDQRGPFSLPVETAYTAELTRPTGNESRKAVSFTGRPNDHNRYPFPLSLRAGWIARRSGKLLREPSWRRQYDPHSDCRL